MQTDLVISLVGVFGAVALVVGLVAQSIVGSFAPARRRLHRLAQPAAEAAAASSGLFVEPEGASARIAKVVPKSPKDMMRLRRRMVAAGYRSASAAVFFAAAEILCAALLAALPILLLGRHRGLIPALVGGVVGYLAPGFWLERRIALRKRQIQNGLADALDLLIVCIEAGSSLDQAILKASEELALAYPALAEELALFVSEVRAGKPRLQAWKDLAARTRVEDVRALVSMLVQTDRFGTSVAQALRTHSETCRTVRRQRAEERAAKIGVKLVFPLVFCLFPAFYVVVLGPAVVQYVNVFRGEIVK